VNTAGFNKFDCSAAGELLDSYIDRELPDETRRSVEAHLETCAACQGALSIRKQIRARLKTAVANQEVPSDLQARIHLSLTRESNRNAAPNLRRPQTWWMAAAAMLIVALGSWAVFRVLTHRAESRQALAAQNGEILNIGLEDHVHCALGLGFADRVFSEEQMAKQLGPDYAGLVDIVKGQVPGDLKVIVGHRCGVNGRKFVHLILRNQDTIVSVVITKRGGESFAQLHEIPAPGGLNLHKARLDNLEVAGFETPNYLVFVVSNMPDKDNAQIAASIAAPVRDKLGQLNAMWRSGKPRGPYSAELIQSIHGRDLVDLGERGIVEDAVTEEFDRTIERHYCLADVNDLCRAFSDNVHPQYFQGVRIE
jgi:anti-sigma factor (TIGR02949 family)